MRSTSTLVAGRYRLAEQLGSGGMGVVWEAYDELLHRPVAVKEVRYPPGISDEERDKLARRTLREARAVAAVEDPHAVRVFDIVEQDGRPWIVMEVVRGSTLTEVIRERGALPVREVARIGLGLLDALAAAHAAGVLHRDVKPSNVILGDDGRIALTDFGIATVDSDPSDVTTSGQIVGSPAYMAPERARGEPPTPAADLWSLGATLWTAAEGLPPYAEGNAFATMTKVVTEDPPACTRCTGELASLIDDLMSRDASQRPDVALARQRLMAAQADASPTAEVYPTEPLPPAFDRTMALERPVVTPAPAADTAAPVQIAPPAQPPQRRRRSPLPIVVALLAVAVLGGVLAYVLASPKASGSHSAHSSAKTSPAPAPKQPSAGTSSAVAQGLPAGWRRYTDPSVGWSVGVPASWTVQHGGSSTYFRDPAGGRYLQVDTKYPAGPSAKGAWEDQERSFAASHPGYHRIGLDNVQWRNYPDVADWEFTYTAGAVTLHAVDRGAVVANRGYGLFFQTHADQWDASKDILRSIYASFSPGR